MATITLGLDLSKQLFSVCELGASGRVVQRRDLRRDAFAAWLAQRLAGAIVAMEACSSAHHWARRCLGHGLQPRLMAAQFVKPFRKSQGNKNDRNDAGAIATAARPHKTDYGIAVWRLSIRIALPATATTRKQRNGLKQRPEPHASGVRS